MSAVAVLILAAAPALACYEAPGSRRTTCIDEANVRVNGDVRASPIYQGGPNGVKKSSQIFVVDCKAGIATIQDQTGVNSSGAATNATAASRAMSQWLCEAKAPKKDPKLRQF